MKEWFKFMCLSFFSDKKAEKAPSYGLGSILLSAVLCVVFLLFGLIAAFTLPVKINYKNTPDLSATVHCAFSADGAALEVNSGVLTADRIIDTVKNEADKTAYSRGYDIIVDTREVDTFDDFTAYCVTASGKEISYEEYLELDADSKTLYTFKVRYSGVERVIDGETIAACENYLDGKTDEATVNAYNDVKKLSGDEYAKALYSLYVRTYYPEIIAYESDGSAPRLRNYYYYTYGNREKILFVFSDSTVGTYVTKYGARNTFYGYYGKVSDGVVGTTEQEIDAFMMKVCGGATSIFVYNGIISFFTTLPFIVLAVIAVSVALLCFSKLLKFAELKFGAAAKIVCSFLVWSALFTAIAMIGFGCLVSQSLLAWLDGVVFFAVLLVRTVIMIIRSVVARKRAVKAELENKDNDGSVVTEENAQ